MLLADPFSTPLVKLLPAFDDAFPGIPMVGGLCSGGTKPRQNRLQLDGESMREGAVGVAIHGPVRVQTTVSGACRAIGQPHVITRAKRHVVQELGGRKALAVVRETAAEATEKDRDLLQTSGLLIGRVVNEYKDRFGPGDFVIRGLVGVDADDGYIAIGDPQVRVGQTVQFHVRDKDAARDDFELMLEAQKLHGPGGGGAAVHQFRPGERAVRRRDQRHRAGPPGAGGHAAGGDVHRRRDRPRPGGTRSSTATPRRWRCFARRAIYSPGLARGPGRDPAIQPPASRGLYGYNRSADAAVA